MISLFAVLITLCPAPPVQGPIVAWFSPSGSYSGHWGVDFAATPGSGVMAALPGFVSFAGSVAGMLTVTIDHGGGVRTSYSFLSQISVAQGQRIDRQQMVGLSGTDHGREAVHFSLRIDGTYVDPMRMLSCRLGPVSEGLHLLGIVPDGVVSIRRDRLSAEMTPGQGSTALYSDRRAPRHPRRNFRSAAHRPSRGRRSGPSGSRRRRRDVRPCRRALAEGGQGREPCL